MIVKSYGTEGAPMVIVKECIGHTCHPQHHVLWYLLYQPTTTVSLKVTYEFDIYIKDMFLKVKGGSLIVPAHLPTGPHS